MPFQRLQWLFPIAVTLHNSEEAIWMPDWARRHAAQLPLRPPGAVELRVALLGLTVAAFAVTFLSVRKGRHSVWAHVFFGYVIAMLVNVLLPHIPATLWFRSYTPGAVTAVLINLPVMTFLALRALGDGWVSGGKAVAFGVGVPLGLGGAIAALFLV